MVPSGGCNQELGDWVIYEDPDALFEQIRDRLSPNHDWSDLLKDPERVEALKVALASKLNNINSQLAAKKEERAAFEQHCRNMGDAGKEAWFASIPEYSDWRTRTIRVQRMIMSRLAQVKAVNKQQNITQTNRRDKTELAETRNALKRLALGIWDHQAEMEEDVAPTKSDRKLWNLLDAVKIPHGAGSITLAEAVEDLWHDD